MAIKNISGATLHSGSADYLPNVIYDVAAGVETYLTTSLDTIVITAGAPVTAGTEVLTDVSTATLTRGCAAATLVATALDWTVNILDGGTGTVMVSIGTGANVRPGVSYNIGFTIASAAGTLDIDSLFLGSATAVPITSITANGIQTFLATVAPTQSEDGTTLDFGIGFNATNVQSCVVSAFTLTQVV